MNETMENVIIVVMEVILPLVVILGIGAIYIMMKIKGLA